MWITPTPFLVSLFILPIKVVKNSNFQINIVIIVILLLKKQDNTKKGVGDNFNRHVYFHCVIIKLNMPPEEIKPKNKRVLIIIIIIIVLVLGVIGFKPIKNWLQVQREKNFSQVLSELQNLIVNKKDYLAALAKAETTVKKYPEKAEAWQWKGIAEFQLGKTNEAKLSFEKVLALDSENKSAKTYLEILNNPNVKLLTQDDFMNQADFEKFFDFPLPSSGLQFVNAMHRPFDSSRYSDYVSVQYTASASAKSISAFFENELNKNKSAYTYAKKKINNADVFMATGPTTNFAISIYSTNPVRIILDVSKKK